jgi:hypothetical protein
MYREKKTGLEINYKLKINKKRSGKKNAETELG